MSVRCVWSKHAPKIGPVFYLTHIEDQRSCQKAVIKLCVYAGTLERCRVRFFFGGPKKKCGRFFFAISLMGVLASRLAWLNCRRFLAGAILLERGCVV